MTTANESKLGGARGGHRGPIVLRVAAARVLPLLPVAARGARLVLSMGLAAGCVRARSSSSPLRGGHCPPLAASTSRLEVWLRCSVHVGCGTPLFRRVVGCRRPARVREGHAEAWQRVAGSALCRAWRGRRGEVEAAGGRVCVCVPTEGSPIFLAKMVWRRFGEPLRHELAGAAYNSATSQRRCQGPAFVRWCWWWQALASARRRWWACSRARRRGPAR